VATKRGAVGSSLDSLLEEGGLLEEVSAAGMKRVIAWQLAQAMKAKGLSKLAIWIQGYESTTALPERGGGKGQPPRPNPDTPFSLWTRSACCRMQWRARGGRRRGPAEQIPGNSGCGRDRGVPAVSAPMSTAGHFRGDGEHDHRLILVYYVAAVAVLSAYGVRVCPFSAGPSSNGVRFVSFRWRGVGARK